MRKDNGEEDRKLLWRACHEADKEALSSVFIKYRKPVCDFLRKIRTNGLAEDICQTVFMNICNQKCDYDCNSNVKNYLFGVARKIRNQELRPINKEVNGQNWEEIADNSRLLEFPTSAEILQQSEFRRILYKKIGELSPKSRQTVQLVYLEGKTRKEVAKELGCNYIIICLRLRYGIKKLIEIFSENT